MFFVAHGEMEEHMGHGDNVLDFYPPGSYFGETTVIFHMGKAIFDIVARGTIAVPFWERAWT